MHMTGGPPDPEGLTDIEGTGRAAICPLCDTLWQLTIVLTTFSPEEQERFWEGKGCPDCSYMWRD